MELTKSEQIRNGLQKAFRAADLPTHLLPVMATALVRLVNSQLIRQKLKLSLSSLIGSPKATAWGRFQIH